jgi:hypothetical protein
MAHYIFHVGPHKTGSTYLQDSFLMSQNDLTERKIVYPAQWLEESSAHHALVRQVKRRNMDLLQPAFSDFSSTESTILISSEDFSDLSVDDWRVISALVARHQVTFVFYCRRWSELLPSGWQEDIRQGSSANFPEFYAPRIGNPFSNNLFNYSLCLDAISAVFGKDSVKLISYSNLRDKNVDIFEHFVRAILTIENFRAPTPRIVNKSFELGDVEIIRALNSIQQLETGHSTPQMRDRYLAAKQYLRLANLLAAVGACVTSLSINENSAVLRPLCDEITNSYGKNLVSVEYGNGLFEQRSGLSHYVRDIYLLGPGIVDELRRTYDKINSIVDEQWYRQMYSDVNQGIDAGKFKPAMEHFERYGAAEGRLPFSGAAGGSDSASRRTEVPVQLEP